ncbi:unnamed protein product [Malus baccata var. baccata]
MSGFTEMRIYKAVESTATEIFLRPSAQASSSPWYEAQSSAAVTGHTPPILSPKPMIHLPLSSLSKPPPVATPAIPLTLPSVLSLTQPEFNHGSFKTKDMNGLMQFRKKVESVLEHLTDESQVLSRFEGFPTKKLEAIRMAAALHTNLNTMLNELQNWKLVVPLGQLLDKAERYFDKGIKGEDTMERTKDGEAKKFQSQNIHFDINILIRIKEAMVYWKAFQFAFRVYTFAGGHDDRADMLTKELAKEIESEGPQHN